MSNSLDTIISRLEQATEGSRELDTAIVLALYPEASIGLYCEGDSEPLVFHAEPLVRNKRELPHYTTSLDAALELVPEGWTWWLMRGFAIDAYMTVHRGPLAGIGVEVYDAVSPALANTMAALKARAAGGER